MTAPDGNSGNISSKVSPSFAVHLGRLPGAQQIFTLFFDSPRGNIYNLLDQILNTGIPIEINKGGKKLRIIPVREVDKLQNLASRPNVIKGNPDDIVDITWEKEMNLDLP